MTQILLDPPTLRGRTVRLEPMKIEHADPLAQVGLDPSLWTWIPHQVASADEMRAYVETALDELEEACRCRSCSSTRSAAK